MSPSYDDVATSDALRALGLGANEARAYRSLLTHGACSVADLAAEPGVSMRGAQRALVELEKQGLVTFSPEKVPRYSAVPPDIAADVLIARRNSELHHARQAMERLREASDSDGRVRGEEERYVELLSRQTAAQIFVHSITSAQHEILALERLPSMVSTFDEPDPRILECMARGVRCRAITDSNLLKAPGTFHRMCLASEAGEEFKIHPSLPFKLIVFDHRMAIIPLHLAQQDGPVLLVRPSSLLDALCEMFEMYWQVGAPFIVGDGEHAADREADAAGPDPLLGLLASGMNDKSIEHELQISTRTLARRVVELTRRLGASSRFQAGWLAAREHYGHDTGDD